MNFALIARFSPLASLLGKSVSQITPTELQSVAVALAGPGPGADSFLTVLQKLQAAAPKADALTILGTDAAQALFKRLSDETEQVNSTMFCTCPVCASNFEVELTV